MPGADCFLGLANVADSDSLINGNQVQPVHKFVADIQTIRRRRDDAQRRCLEVESTIQDHSQMLRMERARLLGQQADIEKRWQAHFESAELSTTQAGDDEQELGSSSEDFASTEDLDHLPRRQLQQEVLQVRRQLQQEQLLRQQQHAMGGLASVQASLQRERASVLLEWQHVGRAAARAERQVKEAEQAGRERASRIELSEALKSDALLCREIRSHTIEAQEKLRRLEERESDVLRQAEAAEEARVESITKLVKVETGLWEQRALLAEEELGADAHESWLGDVLLEHRARAEEHFEEAKTRCSEAIEQELRKEEGQWLAEAQAEWRLEFNEMLLQARVADRDVRLHEERMGVLCEEEASQILQQHETCEQSWLAAALAQTEGTVEARIALARTEYRSLERELIEEATATELNEEALARQLTHRSLRVQQSLDSRHHVCNPYSFHNLHQQEPVRRVEDDIAYRMTLCQEASAAELSILKHTSAVEQEAFQRELQEVEASEDAAFHTIHKLTLHGESQRQEYSDRAERMLTAIAKLEEEKIALSEERRRTLLNRHQAGLKTPPQMNSSVGLASRRKSPESPVVGFVRGRSLLGGSTSSARPAPVKHGPYGPSSSGGFQTDDTGSTNASMTGSSSVCHHTFMSSSFGPAASGASVQQQNTPWQFDQEPVAQAFDVRRVLLQQLESTEEFTAADLGPQSGNHHAQATFQRDLDICSIPSVYQTAIAAVQTYGWSQIHGNGPEWTALHWAASEGRADVCRMLLNAGGKPHQPDSTGRSSVQYALEHGHREIWRLLLEAEDAGVD